jgi:uncharacterized delta-60 repeat protein
VTVNWPLGDVARLYAFLVQPDEKLLVVGSFVPSSAWMQWRFVARFNEDGSLDPAFGAGGYVAFGQPGYLESIGSLALQPDGKILVGGSVPESFLLGHLDEDGSVDAGFGDSGRVITKLTGLIDPNGNSIHLQPDGKTLVQGAGSNMSGAVMMVARFDTQGVLDTTYGQHGVGSAGFNPLIGFAEVSAVLPDGRLLAVGEASNRQNLYDSKVALTGLLPNGNRDHRYQKDTGMSLQFIGRQFTDVAVEINGRIVAAGYGRQQIQTDQTYQWYVVRFTSRQSRPILQQPLPL